ncbi:MAG: tRNA (5-methylaminomethyl-2-thiouridine)(34)-methyltransferase MnmD [Microscillaceae bacterium]|nr:tRNA (5-methylaminomethyl-2-thiouridine)(34)-methyltransferase MnmD [Microscillaceae bacterium]MDW8460733.1 tRNA (5-methylaminomethyl-2-thiouridine)(34)-methyltransferase MnmD [Cytophagales bacterium]
MSLEIVETADGSHSIFSTDFGENYHSRHGALQESKHVFIEAGLNYVLTYKEKIDLLEVGLGTALNALLTLQTVLDVPAEVHYVGLEPLPVPMELVKQLNYPQLLSADGYLQDFFFKIHECPWEEKVEILGNFSITKHQTSLESFSTNFPSFDLVYFDAFAPVKHPVLWEVPALQHLHSLMRVGGILVTYCAKGQFKRNLKEVGFLVEALPGPKGKREMTRATKI